MSLLPSYPHCASNAWTTARVVESSSTSKIFMGWMDFLASFSMVVSSPSTTHVPDVHCMFQWFHHFACVKKAWCCGTYQRGVETTPVVTRRSLHRISQRLVSHHVGWIATSKRETTKAPGPQIEHPPHHPPLQNDPSTTNPPDIDHIHRGVEGNETFQQILWPTEHVPTGMMRGLEERGDRRRIEHVEMKLSTKQLQATRTTQAICHGRCPSFTWVLMDHDGMSCMAHLQGE